MTLLFVAVFCAAALWILSASKMTRRLTSAPALLIGGGFLASLLWRATGAPAAPSDLVAIAAECGLAALAFAAGAQFRVSRLAVQCPASFRLTLGGAPLFLVFCTIGALFFTSQLTLPSAMLLSGVLLLNGSAFDRRALANTPAPALTKSAVRLEGAAVLALGVPMFVLIEAYGTGAATGAPVAAPLMAGSLAVLKGFGIGGALGLGAAFVANRRASNHHGKFAILAGVIAFAAASFLGASALVAAMAAGLLWGEQTIATRSARIRLRHILEEVLHPVAYLAFGLLLAPRLLQADILIVVFAIAAVTILRAGPRMVALKSSGHPKEARAFLAWFGGAPGAASALALLSLMDNAMLKDQDALLTIGAVCVALGVIAARVSSRTIANAYLRQNALAKKRKLFSATS